MRVPSSCLIFSKRVSAEPGPNTDDYPAAGQLADKRPGSRKPAPDGVLRWRTRESRPVFLDVARPNALGGAFLESGARDRLRGRAGSVNPQRPFFSGLLQIPEVAALEHLGGGRFQRRAEAGACVFAKYRPREYKFPARPPLPGAPLSDRALGA
jgi:hypothetical protein